MTERMEERYPVAPAHPAAAEVEGELRRVQVLAERWTWNVTKSGALVVGVLSSVDQTSLRVVVRDDLLELDVFAGYAPFNAASLATLLRHNHSRDFKARAAPLEGVYVPIYVSARFPRRDVARLGAQVWDAFEEAFMWRGELNRLHERSAATREDASIPPAQA